VCVGSILSLDGHESMKICLEFRPYSKVVVIGSSYNRYALKASAIEQVCVS
jgi:hypothetical protein